MVFAKGTGSAPAADSWLQRGPRVHVLWPGSELEARGRVGFAHQYF